MTQFVPVVYPVISYATGLGMSWTSTTTITIAAGKALDSAGIVPLSLSSATVLNVAINGLNGLDTGTIAASTWYYVFIVGDSSQMNATGVLLSLSKTAPTVPSVTNSSNNSTGYDSIRRIGAIRMNSSAQFDLFYQTGNGTGREFWYDTIVSVLTGGTSSTLALVDLSAAVPPIAKTPVVFEVSVTPATANDTASLATPASVATVLPSIAGSVAAKVNSGQLRAVSDIASSVAKIQYINSAASGSTSIWVCSYIDFI